MKLDIAALQAIEAGGRVPVHALLESISEAVLGAYRKNGGKRDARVDIDQQTGALRIMARELDGKGNVLSEWDDTPQGEGWLTAAAAARAIGRVPRVRDELAERIYNLVREEPGEEKRNAPNRDWAKTEKDGN